MFFVLLLGYHISRYRRNGISIAFLPQVPHVLRFLLQVKQSDWMLLTPLSFSFHRTSVLSQMLPKTGMKKGYKQRLGDDS